MHSDTLLQKLKGLSIVERGTFLLRSGVPASFYFNVKKTYGDPSLRGELCDALWELINPRVTCVAGQGHGGIPLATTLSERYRIPLTLIRNEPREHGLRIPLDGYVPGRHDLVAVVDDVLTSGGAMSDSINALASVGAPVIGCYVIVKRGNGELSVPLSYLFTAEQLLT